MNSSIILAVSLIFALKLEWERRQRERQQGRVPHSIEDQELMQAELHRYDGPKVAADGCAMGRA